MLQLALFRLPRVPGVLAIGAVTNAAFYGLIFSLSVYFQNACGFTATESGLALAPLTIIMLANIASARLAVRYGFRATVIIGLAVSLAGYVWLWQTLAAHTPYLLLAPGLAMLTCMSLNAGRYFETGSVSWRTPSSTSIIAATETSGFVIE